MARRVWQRAGAIDSNTNTSSSTYRRQTETKGVTCVIPMERLCSVPPHSLSPRAQRGLRVRSQRLRVLSRAGRSVLPRGQVRASEAPGSPPVQLNFPL